MVKTLLYAASCAMLMNIAACTVGPDFSPPKPIDKADWNDPSTKQGAVTEQANPDPEWWSGFNDPVLTALIEKSIKGNLDVPLRWPLNR